MVLIVQYVSVPHGHDNLERKLHIPACNLAASSPLTSPQYSRATQLLIGSPQHYLQCLITAETSFCPKTVIISHISLAPYSMRRLLLTSMTQCLQALCLCWSQREAHAASHCNTVTMKLPCTQSLPDMLLP